jgi:hypothetical protein
MWRDENMGFTYSFVDNAVYGPEDINDITRSLVGAGVAPFLTKDSYNVSDLNALTSALVETGTSLGGCKCSVENAGTEEMTVTVAQGIVFFESGVSLTVDEEGYVIHIAPNQAGYVYAHYSLSLQKVDIVFDSELPTDGEYVVLARIEEGGSLKDKRSFARAKIAMLGKNVTLTPSFERVEPELAGTDASTNQTAYILAKAPDVDLSKFNYALVYSPEYASYQIIDLTDADSAVYLGWVYNYGPRNYAQVIDGRLCVKQVGYASEVPYIGWNFENELLSYKIILV